MPDYKKTTRIVMFGLVQKEDGTNNWQVVRCVVPMSRVEQISTRSFERKCHALIQLEEDVRHEYEL